MGSLTPDVTYIYERANGIIYARELGKTERVVVGYDGDLVECNKRLMNKWNDILKSSESDPALKEMLDQVEIYYKLKHQS